MTTTTKTTYKPWREVDFSNVRFEQRNLNGKWRIDVVRPTLRCITPAMRTNWPKLGKDADIGTNYGPPPEERHKAKFQVDLTDIAAFDGNNTFEFEAFAKEVTKADDALLDFMCQNQARYLKRTGLGRDNVDDVTEPVDQDEVRRRRPADAPQLRAAHPPHAVQRRRHADRDADVHLQ